MAGDNIREKLNIKLFRFHGRNGNNKLRVLASEYNQQDAGFTMIELIAVAIIVGILAAIAAPGWLGFINRQRVSKANDAVLSALQQAQRQAKKTKVDYSVSFRTTAQGIPQFAVYPGTTPPPNPLPWQNFTNGTGNQPKQIVLGTNLNNINSKQASVTFGTTTAQTIKFDSMGILAPKLNNTPSDTDLAIVVAVTNPSNAASPNLKQCVIVKTLLGTMITGKDAQCI
ncbi:MAG TPA: type II secretion system protein [Nodularia sp. (in: cyanobacteria)]|nr:type II secretion system protein [Nodularia sp. (in: cyanobacteria)]